jgi:flavin-dependent dehydrogenase
MNPDFDVIVVGARCAGAATALLLSRAGARVLVIDRGVYGSDTVSTHALMRGAVMQLHRWGVLPRIQGAGTPPVRTTTFGYRSHQVTVAIEPRYGVEALYAPRRTVLDRALVDEATLAGAEFSYRTRLTELLRNERGRVNGAIVMIDGQQRVIHADLVIGADGVHSTVARRAGARQLLTGRYKTATLYSYWHNLGVAGYEWHFTARASYGAIPTNDGATCVFLAMPSENTATMRGSTAAAVYEHMLRARFPKLSDGLDAATRVDAVRGIGGEDGFLKQSVGEGWALVGDAAYFKDPLTAHGITDALRDAELLAHAVSRGTSQALAEYMAMQRTLSERLFDVTNEIASFHWTDEELQRLHRAFSREMAREQRALVDLPPWPWQSADSLQLAAHA